MTTARTPVRWISLGVLGWLAGLALYLVIQRLGAPRAGVLPWTALDRAIPATAWALPVYLANLVTAGLPFLALREARRWRRAALALTAAVLMTLAVHLVWPTAVDRTAAPALPLLHAVDGAGNAFPSLHALTAVFAARLCHGLGIAPVALAGAWLWTALVLASCLALRQHGVADLAAGGLLGWITAHLAGVDRREPAS